MQSAFKLKINNFKQPKTTSIEWNSHIHGCISVYPYFATMTAMRIFRYFSCIKSNICSNKIQRVKQRQRQRQREGERSVVFDLISLTNSKMLSLLCLCNKWCGEYGGTNKLNKQIQDTAERCMLYHFINGQWGSMWCVCLLDFLVSISLPTTQQCVCVPHKQE